MPCSVFFFEGDRRAGAQAFGEGRELSESGLEDGCPHPGILFDLSVCAAARAP